MSPSFPLASALSFACQPVFLAWSGGASFEMGSGRGRFWGPRPRCEQSKERLGVATSLCQRGALPILPVFEKWCYKAIVCKSKGPKPGSFPCISRVSIRKRSINLTSPENNGVLDSQCHVCTGGRISPFPHPASGSPRRPRPPPPSPLFGCERPRRGASGSRRAGGWTPDGGRRRNPKEINMCI